MDNTVEGNEGLRTFRVWEDLITKTASSFPLR